MNDPNDEHDAMLLDDSNPFETLIFERENGES